MVMSFLFMAGPLAFSMLDVVCAMGLLDWEYFRTGIFFWIFFS